MQMQTEVTGTTMSDQVLGNLSTAILMLDEPMTILFTNQAAESLLQESSEHMTGRAWKVVSVMAANWPRPLLHQSGRIRFIPAEK